MAYAAEWQRLITGARLEVTADAGHMVPYERPAEIASVVAQFLTS
jgi:pimeloyl-ACP methyl ester carboxylesterase